MTSKNQKNKNLFFIRIILPSFLAIFLFVFALYNIILPSLEKNFMSAKKEMIRELTNTALAVINKSILEAERLGLSLKETQNNALNRIKYLYYGQESKDYFFITDLKPKMLMHPYRTDLDGQDLSGFKDPKGKKLFIEFKNIVEKEQEGYVEYLWQWKDDPSRIEPKISYVKLFKPWNWIIGTGVYIGDVKKEVRAMENRLIHVTLIIIFIISILILFMLLQSYKIEKRKKLAEEQLEESQKKYQLLVESSTEGFILVVDGQQSFCNQKLREILDTQDDCKELDINQLFFLDDDEEPLNIQELMGENESISQIELKMRRADGKLIDILLSVSPIEFQNQQGMILITKDITHQKRAERGKTEKKKEQLFVELQSSLLILNQPVKNFIKPVISCPGETTISAAAAHMRQNSSNALLVEGESAGTYKGIVTDKDFRVKVIEVKSDYATPLEHIMSSPVIALSERSLIFEAMLFMQDNEIKHLAVKNETDQIVGMLNDDQIFQIQSNTYGNIIQEIKLASTIDEIKNIREKMPQVMNTLVENGANARNINLFLTRVSDSVSGKLIDFALRDLGPAPAHFAFMALGSEGREEETLLTDQDNILIYEDVAEIDKKRVETYFLKLGEYVCDALNDCGYHYCKGEVMAKNPKWNQPLNQWKKYFRKWIMLPEPQALLQVNIFFDFRTVYSSQKAKYQQRDPFFYEMRNHIYQLTQEKPDFFVFMAKNALLYRSPIGFMGNITLEEVDGQKDVFSIKEPIALIVNFARIYSLQNNIIETNTLERLELIYHKNIISESTYQEITHVYHYLMQLRIRHQAKLLGFGKEPNNLISPKKLSNIEHTVLKKILSNIRTFQSRLNFDFLGNSMI